MLEAELEAVVVQQIGKDLNQMQGPVYIQEMLQDKLICVTRQVSIDIYVR
jgi:hypothetical protein